MENYSVLDRWGKVARHLRWRKRIRNTVYRRLRISKEASQGLDNIPIPTLMTDNEGAYDFSNVTKFLQRIHRYFYLRQEANHSNLQAQTIP